MAIAACALLLGGCDLLRPFDQVCERRLQPASFRVIVEPVQHELDASLSATELTRRGATTANRLVLGITSATMRSSIAATGNGLTAPLSRRFCVRPQVEVRLSVNPLKVHIAREQAAGTCEHGITLTHEMKHVRVYERYLDELAPRLESELKARIGDRLFHYASRAEGERELPAMVDQALRPLIEQGMRDAEQRQKAVDTPEEYARLDESQSRCLK